MKHCPECSAPNPPRLTSCHYCGANLDAPKPGTALPGQPTFPCANCEGAIPMGARSCPHCGRVIPALDSRQTQMVAGPPGWEAQPYPDGTIVLRRTGWGRFTGDMAQPFGLIFLFYYVFASGFRFALRPQLLIGWVMVVPLFIFLLTIAVWLIWGREELRVGYNQLEVRKRLGKWCKVKRLSDGLLVLRWDRDLWGRGYDRTLTWRLETRGVGGGATLDSRSERVYQGLLGELIGGGELPPAPPELIYLGEWLAERTGWNFDQPLISGKGRWS